MATDYASLIQFATVRQIEIIEAIIETGSQQKASHKLGLSRTTVRDALIRVKEKAAKRDPKQHDYRKPLPPGYKLKGISQYINADGEIAGQWVKSDADAEQQAIAQRTAIEAMCEDIPKMGAIASPKGTLDHLCNVYTLTDCHVGAMAWNVETQSGDWDLAIAEQVLIGCFSAMIEASPKAKTCVIAQLGDFLHYDSAIAPVTPLHGNALDADGRMPKMVRTAIKTIRTITALALAKHECVILLLAEGNHDLSSSVWLRAMFQSLYENEPRITVIDSELPYYIHQHGQTMLAWHHGHLTKNAQLPILFAAQFPKIWGGTTKRYCHTGHRHHTEEKEHSGMTVIQHPTLAARDAYAARGGWIADRQVTSITYSDKFGQVARNTVCPEMLA